MASPGIDIVLHWWSCFYSQALELPRDRRSWGSLTKKETETETAGFWDFTTALFFFTCFYTFLHFKKKLPQIQNKIPTAITKQNPIYTFLSGRPSTPVCFPHTDALCLVPRGASRAFCFASSLTLASLSNFPKQDPTQPISLKQESPLKRYVDLVAFSCAFFWAIVIPCCLLHIYRRQHIILQASRTTVALATDEGSLKVSVSEVLGSNIQKEFARRLVAAAAAYIAVLYRGRVSRMIFIWRLLKAFFCVS